MTRAPRSYGPELVGIALGVLLTAAIALVILDYLQGRAVAVPTVPRHPH